MTKFRLEVIYRPREIREMIHDLQTKQDNGEDIDEWVDRYAASILRDAKIEVNDG